MHRPARQKENEDSSLKERESSADRAAENKRGVCQREEQREWDDEGKAEADKPGAAEDSGTMKGKAEAEKSAAAEAEKLDSGE